MDIAVIPECYIDTNLVETLVPPKTRYNHQHGCTTVAKKMKENFPDSFALGIIDKDKNEIDYLSEFDVIATSGSLLLHKHKTKNHFFIQVNPAMERFILNNAAAVNLNLADFGLPTDLDQLRKYSKLVRSKDDIRFKKLFKAIFKNGTDEFKRMAAWIRYMKENPYSIDLNTLCSL